MKKSILFGLLVLSIIETNIAYSMQRRISFLPNKAVAGCIALQSRFNASIAAQEPAIQIDSGSDTHKKNQDYSWKKVATLGLVGAGIGLATTGTTETLAEPYNQDPTVQELNVQLLEAVKSRDIDAIENLVAQGATNLESALLFIINKDYRDFNVANSKESIMHLEIEMNKDLEVLQLLANQGGSNLDGILEAAARAKLKPEHLNCSELYLYYKKMIQILIQSGAKPLSQDTKDKVTRIFLFSGQESFLKHNPEYHETLHEMKKLYQDTELALKNSLKAKGEANLTPTEQITYKYLKNNPGFLLGWTISLNIKNKTGQEVFAEFAKVIDFAASQERENPNKVTFFTARRWDFNFLNDITNLIIALEQNKAEPENGYIFRKRSQKSSEIKQLLKDREDLVANGVVNNAVVTSTTATGKYSELTYMNRTFLSNLAFEYECGAFYFFKNFSCAPKGKALDIAINMLKEHGLSAYEDKVKELYKHHQKLSLYGELCAVSIDESKVNDLVYPSHAEGYKLPKNYEALSKVKSERKKVVEERAFFDTQRVFNKPLWTWNSQLYVGSHLGTPGDEKYTNVKSYTSVLDQAAKDEYEKDRVSLYQDMKQYKKNNLKKTWFNRFVTILK